MIETIGERLDEQVGWLELHGKTPTRVELGKWAYRKLLRESKTIEISPYDQLMYWQGLEVVRPENLRDPWRAFVYCSDDPTENQ